MARRGVEIRRISVMISSQCRRHFPANGRSLTDIRQTLRDELEAEKLFGQQLFTVWINEDAPAGGLDEDSWATCVARARDADILLVLDAGHAGSARSPGDIGICHAELMEGANNAPAKVRIIPVAGAEALKDEDAESNDRFRTYVGGFDAFSPPVTTEAALLASARHAVADAVAKLVQLGVREGRKGGFYSGAALEWSRLNYADREDRMTGALERALLDSGATLAAPRLVLVPLLKGTVAFHLHAAPAGLAIAASRERLGRPFVEDYAHVGSLPAGVGPLHVIACQGSATEAQARALLGLQDVTLVRPPFGVFAADEIHQIQFVLLRDCRDESTIRNGVHRMLAWLKSSGEEFEVQRRAGKRRIIAETIAEQLKRDS